MDVQMPKMDGFKVVEQLREDPATARVPIIFVTAAAREPADVAHGLKLGADDYIRKPYNYHELLARARSKMHARQLEDRLQRRNEQLEALVRIGADLNQRLGLSELIDLLLALPGQELGAEAVELFLFDEQQRLLHCQKHQAPPAADLNAAEARLKQPKTVAGQVYASGEPLLIADTTQASDKPTDLESSHLRSAIAVPFRHQGKLMGILIAAHSSPNRFSDTDLRLLRSIGEQAALAARNAQLHAELQRHAQNLESMVEVRTQELRAAQDQLVRTEKLAALGRLAAGIAHEVNNPLQPILNCLEVATEDIESGEPVDVEVLRVAEKEVQRIKTIVARLLDFARPGTGDMRELEIHPLVQEVLVLARKQLERMHIELTTNIVPVPPLIGNPAQLKQVILNLVLNAMEAMPDGGRLTVGLCPDGGGAAITVRDTGMGMDSEAIAQIFDPFYSTKEDGTGLGLAVSYGIIEGHGGQIRVESLPNKGTTFTIWLPLPTE
jgi:signal transduction histidine kinase